jgi:hypothetical protein
MISHDKNVIIHSIQSLMSIGQVFEIRALGVTRAYGSGTDNFSGFFQFDGGNAAEIADQVLKINRANGVYITLNPVDQSLLALSFNHFKIANTGGTTSDSDILARKYLPIDIDPERKSGTSATDDQVKLAQDKAREVFAFLRSEGWADPVVAFSGNGFHLLYHINQEVNDGGIVKKFLDGLAKKFDAPGVKIDTTVHNPARIMRLYGTVARKGDEVPQLSIYHRVSKIISSPSS